ncbi:MULTISPECIES: hypothetical protein [Cellulophaga]|uniref:hypothetical protein n=1 Tax=Cellulophaga TaxID=104264 RepID=UPI0020903D8D|nr:MULTISPECIES: hypothetical protein [Cellulophaga]MDO6768625.1 hypothetical protein [Cellulophaga sp. 1_MG-2023]
MIKSILMKTTEERKYPIYICISLFFLIVYKVIPNNYTSELYYYFIGLIIGLFTTLALLFINFKSSLHMLGIGSLVMYLISLSIHFEINITISISILIALTGLIASSRLYFKAHKKIEVLGGLLIGIISQFITLSYWL